MCFFLRMKVFCDAWLRDRHRHKRQAILVLSQTGTGAIFFLYIDRCFLDLASRVFWKLIAVKLEEANSDLDHQVKNKYRRTVAVSPRHDDWCRGTNDFYAASRWRNRTRLLMVTIYEHHVSSIFHSLFLRGFFDFLGLIGTFWHMTNCRASTETQTVDIGPTLPYVWYIP